MKIRFASKIFGIVMLTSILLLGSTSPMINDAFASHLSENIKWQLVLLAQEPACSNYHLQMMNKYDELTEKYFELYQFENSKYESLCFTLSEYSEEYSSPQDLDLIIIVLDRDLGQEELHLLKMGGLYTHTGSDKLQNHAIILCDCSNFYYSDPVWILTHELSHFVLFYLNYEMSVIEDLIHSFDEKYDQCRENSNSGCESISTKLRVDSMAYSFAVMPIYEPAVGANKQLNMEIPPNLLALGKEITKWWASGKINDGDFANVVGFLKGGDEVSLGEVQQVLFKDDPLDKDVVTWDEIIQVKPQKDLDELLSKIPMFTMSDDERTFLQEKISGMPDWFKQTAIWWAEDKISDDEFIKNVEYLRNAGILRSR